MILRYNEDLKKALNCKTKPEPWMHVCVFPSDDFAGMYLYAVYVWDTRLVLEVDTTMTTIKYIKEHCECIKANDSREKLQGSSSYVTELNHRLQGTSHMINRFDKDFKRNERAAKQVSRMFSKRR